MQKAMKKDVTPPQQSPLRTALAGLIGNVLEWFDFAVYGYFASDIGRQFFPQSSPAAQQLLAFAVFALGFLARPVGSIVLGAVGDAQLVLAGLQPVRDHVALLRHPVERAARAADEQPPRQHEGDYWCWCRWQQCG